MTVMMMMMMMIIRVPTHPGKSLNLRKEFYRPGKSWKMTVVMESHGIPPIGHGIFLTEG